ncbi:MAG: glycosyltransferase family 2 protein [Lachnospirales bacterium]
MERVELSIIVPIYNQERYLEECLKSIEEQAYQSYEVILIDDGSIDSSNKICERFCNKNKHFNYIYQNNGGLGSARNLGLNIASGNYIMFVDSDDCIIENCLDKLMAFATKNKMDIIYFDEIVCNEELKNEVVIATLPVMDCNINKEIAFRNCFSPAHIWARIYKRELFNNLDFKNIWYEDVEIFPKLLNIAQRIGYYKIPLYKYRQHSVSITHQNHDARNLDIITSWLNSKEAITPSNKYNFMFNIALRLSVYDFIFYKKFFSKEYIEWYNENLLINHEICDNKLIDFNLIKDCQLINQAKMYNLESVIKTIECLLEVYEKGRLYINNEFFAYENEKDGIYINIEDEKINVVGFCLKEKSNILITFFEDIQKENIISKQMSIKYDIIDRLLIKNAILNGIKINIIKGKV